jgi:hypothetical protein
MQALRRSVVVGAQTLRAYKQKIQATKPKDTTKMVCDGIVVSASGPPTVARAPALRARAPLRALTPDAPGRLAGSRAARVPPHLR